MMITTEDRLALLEIEAQFDWAIDSDDIAAWIAQCTDDIFFEASYGSARGKADVRALLEKMETGFSKGKRHTTSNHVIEAVGDGAQVKGYLIVFEREKGTNVVATATWVDRYRQQGGSWKLAHRKLDVDPGMQAEQTKRQ